MQTFNDEQDPIAEEMARHGAILFEQMFREGGIVLPPGVLECLAREMSQHLLMSRGRDQHYALSAHRISEVVQALEGELPRGSADPLFLDLLAQRFRAMLQAIKGPDSAPSA